MYIHISGKPHYHEYLIHDCDDLQRDGKEAELHVSATNKKFLFQRKLDIYLKPEYTVNNIY